MKLPRYLPLIAAGVLFALLGADAVQWPLPPVVKCFVDGINPTAVCEVYRQHMVIA